MHEMTHSRRGFLAALAGTVAPLAAGLFPDRAAALDRAAAYDRSAALDGTATLGRAAAGDHPDPRPGVDGSRVLAADAVDPEVAELFDQIRAIPHVVDGVRCYCGCADLEGFYSLLSCYEGYGMAQECHICQGEGRLVCRLHREGRSLDEIRAAIDRRFA